MKRREFIEKLGLTALGAGAISACSNDAADAESKADCAPQPRAKPIKWSMVTTWPKNFPVLGTGAEYLAQLINEMSGGRMQVSVYAAGEKVPALEIFDFVAQGGAQMGHGSAYYWKGKNEAFQFFSTVPFGLTAHEMNAWIYHGGGMELWQEAYKPFGLIPMAAGNTMVQMAGWFNKEINTLDDLKGLKMRIPGLGGEVLRRAGGIAVNIPGGDLYLAMERGRIDATEWVGPYNDLAFGFQKIGKYYYYPGWHEPGTILENFVNEKAFKALPEDLQAIVSNACRVANQHMSTEFTAKNNQALDILVNEHKVDVRRLPDEVLGKLKQLSEEVVQELAAKDEFAGRVYQSFNDFRNNVVAWNDISERAYMNIRAKD